ncbi:unnamed protein product [Ectocarpus fasciculatus]
MYKHSPTAAPRYGTPRKEECKPPRILYRNTALGRLATSDCLLYHRVYSNTAQRQLWGNHWGSSESSEVYSNTARGSIATSYRRMYDGAYRKRNSAKCVAPFG